MVTKKVTRITGPDGIDISLDAQGRQTNEKEYRRALEAKRMGYRPCLHPTHHWNKKYYLPSNENQIFCTDRCLKDFISQYIIPLFLYMAEMEWSFVPKEIKYNGGLPTLNLEMLEKWAIETALDKTGGNQTKAAELLGSKDIRSKMHKHGILAENYFRQSG
jgi:DNA-binding protein Fis